MICLLRRKYITREIVLTLWSFCSGGGVVGRAVVVLGRWCQPFSFKVSSLRGRQMTFGEDFRDFYVFQLKFRGWWRTFFFWFLAGFRFPPLRLSVCSYNNIATYNHIPWHHRIPTHTTTSYIPRVSWFACLFVLDGSALCELFLPQAAGDAPLASPGVCAIATSLLLRTFASLRFDDILSETFCWCYLRVFDCVPDHPVPGHSGGSKPPSEVQSWTFGQQSTLCWQLKLLFTLLFRCHEFPLNGQAERTARLKRRDNKQKGTPNLTCPSRKKHTKEVNLLELVEQLLQQVHVHTCLWK